MPRMTALDDQIRAMPKVELHVHLEGSLQPATLLALVRRHGLALPADTAEGLQAWYTFTDFPHFIEIYKAISACLRTPDDIELVAREFLAGQAAQNIRYSEVTYTAFTHYATKGLSFADQLAALNRARDWAAAELGVGMGVVIDIERVVSPDEALLIADWAIAAHGQGVVALGLGGPEVGNPPERYAAAFERARAAGLPRVPHAGETVGPASMWGALRSLHADRLGHGVRCLEDPALVAELRARQVPLEVCPTSNVCLHVAPSLEQHMLPRLLDEGLYVTLNSDDPPMFNTSLTGEYLAAAHTFGLSRADLQRLALNTAQACLLPPAEKQKLVAELSAF
jgi:adenosine deaminase